MVKVSVVMPAYNSERFIRESIESVINQTYDNWELIIVNDGSKDRTKQIIEEYTQKYPTKIILLHKSKNEGISKGLNSAIEIANGTYICWLSSDDIYVSDMIESEIEFLNINKEFNIVFSNYDLIDSESKFLMSSPPYRFFRELEEGDITQPYRSLLSKYCLNGCSVMCKKEHYLTVGGFNPTYLYAHDYDMWIRFAANYNIGYINKINVHYRIHAEQGTNLGFNEVDSIKSLLDFMRDEDNFNRLLNKAKLPLGMEGNIKVLDNILLRYKSSKIEFNLLYAEAISFISYYCDKHCISSDKWLNNNLIEKMKLIQRNAIIPYDNFFESNKDDNWVKLLCDIEKLDGFIINAEGARFERYTGNDINRLCMGIKYDNLIVTCEMSQEKIYNILDNYNDIKWYFASNNSKKLNTIGVSYYMLTDERYNSIFENVKITITDKDIWNTVMDALVKIIK